MTTNDIPRSKIVESSDTIEAIEECYRMGWSDGLPVVPPVDYEVREMLEISGMTGEEEIISLEMRNRVLTSENVAANAVMIACLQFLGRPLEWWLAVTAWDRAMWLVVLVSVGAASYFFALALVGGRPSQFRHRVE